MTCSTRGSLKRGSSRSWSARLRRMSVPLPRLCSQHQALLSSVRLDRDVPIYAGGSDLDCNGLQLWSGVACDGPLYKAEVTGAVGRELTGEPGLLLQPGQCRQAILVSTAKKVKLSARAESATGALDHHLVAAFGKQIAIDESEESTWAITGADQNRRRRAVATCGFAAVWQNSACRM